MEMPQRIEKLEKERWLYLGVAALGGVAGLLGAVVGVLKGGGTVGNVLVQDSKGRIETLADKAGAPYIVFRDQHNKVRQSIGISSDGQPQIRMLGTDGQTVQATLMTNADGLPRLEMYDAKGEPRSMMGINANGDAMFHIIGPDKKTRVQIEDGARGGTILANDPAGKKAFGTP